MLSYLKVGQDWGVVVDIGDDDCQMRVGPERSWSCPDDEMKFFLIAFIVQFDQRYQFGSVGASSTLQRETRCVFSAWRGKEETKCFWSNARFRGTRIVIWRSFDITDDCILNVSVRPDVRIRCVDFPNSRSDRRVFGDEKRQSVRFECWRRVVDIFDINCDYYLGNIRRTKI